MITQEVQQLVDVFGADDRIVGHMAIDTAARIFHLSDKQLAKILETPRLDIDGNRYIVRSN